MSFESLRNANPAEIIAGAKKRVVYLAPGVSTEIQQALEFAWLTLGPDAVTVIIDPDPEVIRLGYGSFEALERLQNVSFELGSVVCTQPGIRISVVIADDNISVFAPQPLLIASGSPSEVNGISMNLNENSAGIAAELGAGPLGQEARKVGLEGLSSVLMGSIKEDLAKNPPQKFDVAQKVRVFNSAIEFVELEVKGCKVTMKEVTLPRNLIGVSSDEVGRRLRSTYKLVDGTREIAAAQADLEQLRKDIEKRFLRVVAGYGWAVKRTDRDLLDKAIIKLKEEVAFFQAYIEIKLDDAIARSVAEIATALGPAIASSPTEDFERWANWQDEPTAEQFVIDRIEPCFLEAAKAIRQMTVSVLFKGVTYESLQKGEFIDAAKNSFPELEGIFNEFNAAKAVGEDKSIGTE